MQVVVGLVHGQGVAARRCEGLPGQGIAHLADVGATGLLDRLRPHVDADIGGFHRVVRYRLVGARQALVLGVGLPLGDELLVDRILHRLEVVPGGQVTDQRFGVDAAQLLFADREGDHRHVGGFQALVGQFLVERHVGVAVDGRHHRCLAASGELLDVGDDSLVIAVAEGGVDLFDVRFRHALADQEGAQNLVGGARIDVIGAQQEEALGAAAILAHQVFHRRDGLLVRRGAGVEDVRRELFAFVLHGIEQQAVEFFIDRQHGLARHAGPAAEGHRDLVLGEQLAALLGEQRPVRGRVDHHRLELLAEHAAVGVDLVDGHQRHVLERGLGDGHGAGQRMQDTDLDGLGGLQGEREQAAEHQGAGGEGGLQ